MAFTTYFLLLTILCQFNNLIVFSAKEGFNHVITQVGFGNSSFATSNYQSNVNSLLSALISQSSLGYFNTSAGKAPDIAYGWYLCRGDLSVGQCNDCLEDVRQYMMKLPMNNYYYNGFVYNMHLECMVHYANSSSALMYRRNTTFTGRSFGDDLVSHRLYDTMLSNTIQQQVIEASYGNWSKANFNDVEVAFGDETMFVLVQCTPDISAMNCSNCLSNLYATSPPSTIGGAVLGTNCLLKYNDESFIGSGYHSFMPSYSHALLVLFLTIYLTFM